LFTPVRFPLFSFLRRREPRIKCLCWYERKGLYSLLDPRFHGDDKRKNALLIPALLSCLLWRSLFSFPRRREPRAVHITGSPCLRCWIPVFTGMTKKRTRFSFPRRREL
jgi:hypothetical protein